MQSRVLEHQQLAVCLLREQELWEREGDDEQELEGSQGTHSTSPLLNGKDKGPKSQEGWNWGWLSSLPA